jgi:hypothetical protein
MSLWLKSQFRDNSENDASVKFNRSGRGGASIPVDNKSGLYRQFVGVEKAGNDAKRVCRRIADTACCTEPAMGINRKL